MRKFIFLIIILFANNFISAQSTPDTVKIGTYIISLHDINFRDKEYTIRFWMWMKYQNPDFDFANRVEVPNAKTLEKPDIMLDSSDHKIWVLMKMKCVMKQSWRVQDFPFDSQKLVIKVENSEFDTRSLVFVADTAGQHFDPELTADGWDIKNIEIKTGVKKYNTAFGDNSLSQPSSEYSSFEMIIDMDRAALGLFLKLFIGMYVAFCIAYLSFFIHPDAVEAGFGLQVGGLFAAVGNKYIIDSVLPETSAFTLVDMLHSITFITIFFIILNTCIALRYYKRKKVNKALAIEKTGSIVVLLAYTFVNIILVTVCILD